MSPGFDHCDCISESGEFEDMIAERVDLRIPQDDFKAEKFAVADVGWGELWTSFLKLTSRIN